MPDADVVVIAGLAVFIGAIVQGGIGLGLGLVASPVITMLDPSLMPGCPLVLGTVLPLLTIVRELDEVDWGGLRWALTGRVAGTVLGVWILTLLPSRPLGIAVGLMVLVALSVSVLSAIRLPRNPGTLLTAGLVAGTTSASTSIGGPPVALLYQRESGPLIRSTLAVFFCIGAFCALMALGVGHRLEVRQVTTGLTLLPFLVAGFVASGPTRRHLHGSRMRGAVLAVTAASALTLIARNLA